MRTPVDIFTHQDKDFANNLQKRHSTASMWHIVLQISTIIGIVVLMALVINIVDGFQFIIQ